MESVAGGLYARLTRKGSHDAAGPDRSGAEAGNFLRHVGSLTATKLGDGLADPKLVLTWLLTGLGAPAYLTGLMVPLREAGALLPQLFAAPLVQRRRRRKWVWVAGSLVQGLAVAGMGLAALALEGAAVGWTFAALVTLFALARSLCSVSYKDVLGKTLATAARGSATGLAGSLAAGCVLLFGLLLSLDILDRSSATIAAVLLVAAGLWVAAAGLFATLDEPASRPNGSGERPMAEALRQFGLLRSDPQLTRFIVTRSLLIPTALAPPFLLALADAESGNGLGVLGPFVVASALAGIASSYAWGRLADRSSRRVLILAALLAAAVLGLTVLLQVLAPALLAGDWPYALLLFVLVVAYQGVRLGRSTHLVDMAGEDRRAAYTALSNSIVGLLLLAGSLFGLLSYLAGPLAVLAVFALLCAAAALTARGLEEVQKG